MFFTYTLFLYETNRNTDDKGAQGDWSATFSDEDLVDDPLNSGRGKVVQISMMKINKIMIPVVALAMLLTGCDDQIMQWGKPADHADVTKAEIPLAVKEVIANYDNIKDYAQQYTPNMKIGIGMGAAMVSPAKTSV